MCVSPLTSRPILGWREEKKEWREVERADGRKGEGMNLINACLSPFDYKFNMVINHVYFSQTFLSSVSESKW